MNTICDYIIAFEAILRKLSRAGNDNIVLAGSNALKTHGLIMSRESNDLDVVIYDPTVEQDDIIGDLARIREHNPYEPNDYNAGGHEHLKSIKVKTESMSGDTLYLDILVERRKTTPPDLLFYKYGELWFKIQNIKLSIDAKRSYTFSKKENGMSRFIREKDALDFIDLKNSNFNL